VTAVDVNTAADDAQASSRRGSDDANLLAQVRPAGLLDRRPTYYSAKIAINALLVIAGWTAFVLLGDSWWQLVTAAYLAVVFTQTAFLSHDAGHRHKHHRHHADPNQEGLDPDVGGESIAPSRARAGGRRGATRFLARHQTALFVQRAGTASAGLPEPGLGGPAPRHLFPSMPRASGAVTPVSEPARHGHDDDRSTSCTWCRSLPMGPPGNAWWRNER
jgi:hypothetical protein